MTQSRYLLPGMTLMVTRRTLMRHLLLRPDPELNEAFEYLAIVLANRHGLQLHALTVMSTHYHMVVTDPEGKLPLFTEGLHRMVALVVKVMRNWDGPLWGPEDTSVVELCTPHAFIEKCGYVIANPAKDGMVRRSRQWPGLVTLPHELGKRVLHARRPRVFLDPNNPIWPERVSLQLSIPERLPWSDDEVRQLVTDDVLRREREAAQGLRVKGWTVMGKVRVRKASPHDRARSPEPLRAGNPTFAVGRGNMKAYLEAIVVRQTFRRLYRQALLRWRQGVRDVVFPAGTYLMRLMHSVQVAAP